MHQITGHKTPRDYLALALFLRRDPRVRIRAMSILWPVPIGRLKKPWVLVASVAVLVAASHRSIAADLPVQQTAQAAGATTHPADAAPRDMMQQTITELLAILGDGALPRNQKMDRVSALTRQHLDFQTLGRMTLGNSWGNLSETQRTDFIKEFTDHLLGMYLPVVTEYDGQQVSVGEDRTEKGGDHTVLTTVTDHKGSGGAQRQVASISCRLRKGSEGWKVIDLSVENISVAYVFRAQFQPTVASSGIDVLIDRLRQKNAQAKSEEARDNK